MEAVVEKGVIPLSATTSRRNNQNPKPAPPPAVAAKPAAPGRAELIDALKKSDTESVIFDRDLGKLPISNRDILANAFSVTLNQSTIAHAEKKGKDSTESVRLVDDALSCVENIDFIGGRSKLFDNRFNPNDTRNGKFCTMPVKVVFPDKNSRINFERTLSDEAGIRASQSYPKQIREQMTLFRKALLDRYDGYLIMTRPANLPALELIAFIKKDGDPKWKKLEETHPLPLNLMLSSYTFPNHIVLPERVDESPLLSDDSVRQHAS